MGFDVLYLPPIHPIGLTGRKGPGNTPGAGPLDPGSPWAIGSAAGGHTAVDPGLGTLDDFDSFVRQARDHGLEIALDIAYQCSPDHPYVRKHPEWFRHRPDGSIKYAENPPKKYQDIYPFDFETEAWPSLWAELLDVVRFWAQRGVRIFRVDNPHTKPFPFWEWLIARAQQEFPDTIFLSEAFTRPKVMLYLAKLGFTQSYTYFTWRNTKDEIVSYFTELAQPDVADVLRPNLFANTPDILHAYLQKGGRTAFEIRFVLAATLGASYGIYSGFEICENEAVPGMEEYHESEKYQFKPRDWQQPSNIRQLIRTVNLIRRAEPALLTHPGVRFHETDNPEIVAYTRAHPAGTLFVVVSLDPHRMQHGLVRTPLAELDVDAAGFELHDLLDDGRYSWRGEWGYVRFDPGGRIAHIFKAGSPGDAGPADAGPKGPAYVRPADAGPADAGPKGPAYVRRVGR
jgi:starch synthase (maltosyl-transferring)